MIDEGYEAEKRNPLRSFIFFFLTEAIQLSYFTYLLYRDIWNWVLFIMI